MGESKEKNGAAGANIAIASFFSFLPNDVRN